MTSMGATFKNALKLMLLFKISIGISFKDRSLTGAVIGGVS